jgi:tryptophanyl-tRNA synthetase
MIVRDIDDYKIIFTMLCVGLGLQRCSLFNQSECNNQQVTDRVTTQVR